MDRVKKHVWLWLVLAQIWMLCGGNAQTDTIAWIPGSASLVGDRSGDLFALTEWIEENASEENIRFVLHTGSAVAYASCGCQWACISTAFQALDDTVPYSIVPGKLDHNGLGTNYSRFLERFGSSRQKDPEIEWYKDGLANAQRITVGEHELLVLSLGFDVTSDMLRWADGILSKYSDMPVILAAPRILREEQRLSSVGVRVRNILLERHANIRLVLCGNGSEDGHRYDFFDDDADGIPERTVSTLMVSECFPQAELRVTRSTNGPEWTFAENEKTSTEMDAALEAEDSARVELIRLDDARKTLTLSSWGIRGGENALTPYGKTIEISMEDWFR